LQISQLRLSTDAYALRNWLTNHTKKLVEINRYHAYGESWDRRWRENSQKLLPLGFFAGRVFDLQFDPKRPLRNRAK
jgi:hypothetical protein